MSWRRFWQRGRRDEELALELESYLEHEEDEKAGAGLSHIAMEAVKRIAQKDAAKRSA